MRISVLAENLNRGVGVVMRSVSSRPQLPVLANIKLTAAKNGLELLSTDLEMSFRIKVGAKVEQEGEMSVPAKTFGELMGTINSGVVELSSEGEKLTVKAGKTKAVIMGMAAVEFPAIPEFEGEADFEFESQKLMEVIDKVSFSAAKDESRPVFTGVMWRLTASASDATAAGGEMILATTDGYRLSKSVITPSKSAGKKENMSVNIPARSVTELVKAMGKDENDMVLMKIEMSKQQVIFKCGEVELVSRLIGGDFPPFEQILPKSHTTAVMFDRSELMETVRRVSIFARDSANIVKLSCEGEKGVMSANSSTIGSSECEMEVVTEGESLEVAFNWKYLSELLGVIGEERIRLESEGGLKPGVFKVMKKDKVDESYVHVIMPVRVAS